VARSHSQSSFYYQYWTNAYCARMVCARMVCRWSHGMPIRSPKPGSSRYSPPFQIFIDGHWNFCGERFTNEYLSALNGVPCWDNTLRRYRVQRVLVPPEAGLAVRLFPQPGCALRIKYPLNGLPAVDVGRRHPAALRGFAL